METVVGFLIAMIVGLTGMGGGTLLVPVLILMLGRPPAEAVAASLVVVTVVKLLGTSIYGVRGAIHWPTAGRLLAGGLPGVAIGSLLIGQLKGERFESLLLSVIGLTIVILASVNLLRPKAKQRQDRPGRLAWLALPIGVEVGFSSAGAGALGSLVLLSSTTLETGTLVGTELLFGTVLTAFGSGFHVMREGLAIDLVMKLLWGGIPGVLLGSWLATSIPSRHLRTALQVLLIVLGSNLCWEGVRRMF